MEPVLFIKLLHLSKHSLVNGPRLQDKQGRVGNSTDNWSVCHHIDRHIVNEDIVVTCAQLINHLIKTLTLKEFHRVRRNHTCRNEVNARSHILLDDCINLQLRVIKIV